MMSGFVEIGISMPNARKLEFGLRKLDAVPIDYMYMWRGVASVIYWRTRAAFAQEGLGRKWKDLADSTKADRKRKGYSPEHPILERTGDLLRSLTSPGTADAILQITKAGLTIGSSVPYAKFHQTGTGKMPARPPWQFVDATGDLDRNVWLDIGNVMAVAQGRAVRKANLDGLLTGPTMARITSLTNAPVWGQAA